MGKECKYYNCNVAPVEGKTLCKKHLKQVNDTTKKLRANRKAKGLCPMCETKITDKRYVWCFGCRVLHSKRYSDKDNTKAKELRAERKAKGLCTNCGDAVNPNNSNTKVRCDKCYNSKKKYDKDIITKRKKKKLCSVCGGKINPNNPKTKTRCDFCYNKRKEYDKKKRG